MLKKINLFLLLTFCMQDISLHADELFLLKKESFDRIHSDEFVSMKKTFAESPSLFQGKKEFNIPSTIAFEDSHEKINLTPGDVIKLSEDITFSDWGGSSSTGQVAEEDFTLPSNRIKKTEDEGLPKTKNIKFSRTPM